MIELKKSNLYEECKKCNDIQNIFNKCMQVIYWMACGKSLEIYSKYRILVTIIM